MAAWAFSSFRAARYTLAFLVNSAYTHPRTQISKDDFRPSYEYVRVWNTLTVSLPIPVLPPVTITTFPVKSGMSSTENLDFGAK